MPSARLGVKPSSRGPAEIVTHSRSAQQIYCRRTGESNGRGDAFCSDRIECQLELLGAACDTENVFDLLFGVLEPEVLDPFEEDVECHSDLNSGQVCS
jgi:hypothetical protein